MSREDVVFTSIKSKLIPRINQYREIINVEKLFKFTPESVDVNEDLTYQVTTNLHQLTSNYYYYNNKPKKDFNIIKLSADEDTVDSARWNTFDQVDCPDLSHNLLIKHQQHASGRQTPVQDDIETVDDIEKWLEACADSSAIPPAEMDPIKCGQLEGVDRYLGDELPHGFLEKDPDTLSIDIDLSDKKLNLGYDPILQELESEKLLEVCEKDGFIMPEFQLDKLDPMTLAPNDMMVAGEILPSTSINNSSTLAINGHQDIYSGDIKKASGGDTDDICDESSQVYDLQNKFDDDDEANVDNIVNIINESDLNNYDDGNQDDINDDDDDDDDNNEVFDEINSVSTVSIDAADTSLSAADNLLEKTKAASILMSKRHKVPEQLDDGNVHDQVVEQEQGGQSKNKDEIMAVVAISTDKRSNMTQIVINTGKGEQIYRGKTSELMEATGYFSKNSNIKTALTNINTETINSCTEVNGSYSLSNQEAVISKALEELGYSEDNLVSVTLPDNGKMWICPRDDCHREFNRLYALKGHILAHYGVRPFKCDYEGCTWAFHSEFKLKRHKETHLKRKDYVCQVEGCNKRFTTVYNLWTHEKLHTRPNRIACQVPECEEKFQTKRALELHMKTHDQSHAPYVCMHEGCGKRYYSSNALTSHQRCHSYKEIDIKCSWPGCGKIFDKPCRLKAHLRSHTGSKPYLCTFAGCSWAFTSSSKLKRHEKKHTNERKFICDVTGCSKAFMRSEHLKEHKLTHSEGRYFQCYICEASFSAKSSLYVHIKKHQNKIITESATDSIQSLGTRLTFTEGDNLDNFCNGLPMDLESEIVNNNQLQESFIAENLVNSTSSGALVDKTVVNEIITAKPKFSCPIENCSRTYMKKVSLKSHIIKFHGYCIEENELSQSSETDYVLYANNLNNTLKTTRCINVNGEGDIEIVDTVSELSSLPEPKPPPNDKLLKHINNRAKDVSNHGSARTGLTYADIWKIKSEKNLTFNDPIIGPSDVVLGTADLADGLLLPDELPSMYYHDDMAGSECQILLLDSTTTDSETTAY
ncbi:zinc finger Y-chromosomal protein 2 [Microplitis demolitor]|uniref:zinc finger Y-chromosomal protein 2 n=1 Tax=Microplitis demolitor TaxID=69319 RepID=UPI0004CD5627|nr:zinc finger Y-chromosomal protein 2 [Microplitis demolitor]